MKVDNPMPRRKNHLLWWRRVSLVLRWMFFIFSDKRPRRTVSNDMTDANKTILSTAGDHPDNEDETIWIPMPNANMCRRLNSLHVDGEEVPLVMMCCCGCSLAWLPPLRFEIGIKLQRWHWCRRLGGRTRYGSSAWPTCTLTMACHHQRSNFWRVMRAAASTPSMK